MAGYNDPGHPAGLPSEPSPRRLPAGDGSGATAQMEGLQGPGSLQPGFRQCCFPNLREKMLDARGQQEKEKPTARTGRTENPPRGEREATRPKRKTRNQSRPPKPEKEPKKHQKHPEKRRVGPKSLDGLLRESEAIGPRERLHDTLGKCKTSEEVSHFPAPESVVEKTTITAKATHTTHPAPILSVSSS